MMKNLIFICFFGLLALQVSAQEVGNVYDLNSYKYIILDTMNYGSKIRASSDELRTVRNCFLKKKFRVYMQGDDLSKTPGDFKTDSCIILECKIEYTSDKNNLFERATITLINCIGEIVYENTDNSTFGGSVGALENAFEPIMKMKYEYDSNRKIN